MALCDRAGPFLNRRLVTAKHPFSGAIGSAGVEIDGCPQNSRARMTCFADQEISDKTCISCNSIPSRDIQCTRPGFYRSFLCMRDDFYVCRRIARGIGSGWRCPPRCPRRTSDCSALTDGMSATSSSAGVVTKATVDVGPALCTGDGHLYCRACRKRGFRKEIPSPECGTRQLRLSGERGCRIKGGFFFVLTGASCL